MNIYHNHWTPLEPLAFNRVLNYKVNWDDDTVRAAAQSAKAAEATKNTNTGVFNSTSQTTLAGGNPVTPPPAATGNAKAHKPSSPVGNFAYNTVFQQPDVYSEPFVLRTINAHFYNLFTNPTKHQQENYNLVPYKDQNGDLAWRFANGVGKENFQEHLIDGYGKSYLSISDFSNLLENTAGSIKNSDFVDQGVFSMFNVINSSKLYRNSIALTENGQAAIVHSKNPNYSGGFDYSIESTNEKGETIYIPKKGSVSSQTLFDGNFDFDSFRRGLSGDAFKTKEELAKMKAEKEKTASFLTPDWVQAGIYGVSSALSSAVNVGSLWLGYSQFEESKRQYEEQKERLIREENRQVKAYNNQLGDHLSGRGFVNSSSASLRNISKNYRNQKFDKVSK